MTYLFRQCIVEQESIAFYNQTGQNNAMEIKITYNQRVKTELWNKWNIYKNLEKQNYFSSIFAVNDYLLTWENEQWNALTLF